MVCFVFVANQCKNLEFVLIGDPTFVMHKLGHNLVTADVYFPWNRTKCEWLQCVTDPEQHVVSHGFIDDGRAGTARFNMLLLLLVLLLEHGVDVLE